MASDSSSNQYYHDTDLPEGGDGSFLLSYPYTDIDADRIETPRVFTHLSENAANVDKSNAYFSDYTPLDTNRSETPRNFSAHRKFSYHRGITKACALFLDVSLGMSRTT